MTDSTSSTMITIDVREDEVVRIYHKNSGLTAKSPEQLWDIIYAIHEKRIEPSKQDPVEIWIANGNKIRQCPPYMPRRTPMAVAKGVEVLRYKDPKAAALNSLKNLTPEERKLVLERYL